LERKEEGNGLVKENLYDKGSVMDAAKLGLPKAQRKVADYYFNRTNGEGLW